MIANASIVRARRAAADFIDPDSPDILKGLIAGVAAGLIASLVMDGIEKVISSASGEQDQGSSQPGKRGLPPGIPAYTPEAQARMPSGDTRHKKDQEGEQATERAATAVAESAGVHLTQPQKKAGGVAVHLGFGTSVGALYGALAEVAPVVTIGVGMPYGAAVWLLADETALSLLGLEPPPHKRPATQHASMFAMHLVYGATLDLLRRGIRSLL